MRLFFCFIVISAIHVLFDSNQKAGAYEFHVKSGESFQGPHLLGNVECDEILPGLFNLYLKACKAIRKRKNCPKVTYNLDLINPQFL
ncbi:MAG: hypothetical protein ACRBBN_21100, partial [Methyloligellaceae bacterium]